MLCQAVNFSVGKTNGLKQNDKGRVCYLYATTQVLTLKKMFKLTHRKWKKYEVGKR